METFSKRLEKYAEQPAMSSSLEASVLIHSLAGRVPAGTHTETAILSVARRLKIGFRRAKAIWYQEARRIDADEMDALRGAVAEYEGAEIELRTRCQILTGQVQLLRERLAQERAKSSGGMADLSF